MGTLETRTSSARWKRLRSRVIRTRPHRCHWCYRDLDPKARFTEPNAIQVDHVRPVKTYPELAWDEANLVLSCPGCNNAKRARYQDSKVLRRSTGLAR